MRFVSLRAPRPAVPVLVLAVVALFEDFLRDVRVEGEVAKRTVDVGPDLPILWSNLAFSTSYNDPRGHTHRLYVGAGRGAHLSTGPGRAPGPVLWMGAGRLPGGCRAAAGRLPGG